MKRFAISLWTCVLAGLLPAVARAGAEDNGPDPGCGVEFWSSFGGTLAVFPSATGLEALGLEISGAHGTDVIDEAADLQTVFATVDVPGLRIVSYDGIFRAFDGGSLQTLGEIRFLTRNGLTTSIGDLRIEKNADETTGPRWIAVDGAHDHGAVFELMPAGLVQLSRINRELQWNGLEIFLTPSFAEQLGVTGAEVTPIGVAFFRSEIQTAEPFAGFQSTEPGDGVHASRGVVGPDIIVGDIYDIRKWSTVGTQSSFSYGTEACNIGDEEAEWIANNNRHPVIGQAVYRMKNNRFEMIGLGWLKHSFCAIDLDLCTPCPQTSGCEVLSVDCSDPYSAFLNGDQGGLGPRYQVNPTNGVFPYPPANPGITNGLSRRTILNHTDINPNDNPGALYFVEAHYVTQDDAQRGNGVNNTSYRAIRFDVNNNCFFLGPATVRTMPAVFAWEASDAAVETFTIDVAGDGRFIIGWKIVDNGDGTWTYNYVIENMNSNNAARTFTVPVPAGVNVTNPYFTRPLYHSGEIVDNTNWTFTRLADKVRWSGQTVAENPNGNALRWSTAYSFGFTTDTPPRDAQLGSCDQYRVENNFKFEIDAPSALTNPFDLSISLVSDIESISIGQRYVADATVITTAGFPTTQVRFTLEAERPDGSPYEGNPLINRLKDVPGNLNKTREVKFVGADEVGTWTLRLIAQRTSDGSTKIAEIPFVVTN